MLSRYQITERNDQGDASLDNSRKAQAFKRASGMFDLRDTQSGHVICASSSNLSAIRKMQARLNTSSTLDAIL